MTLLLIDASALQVIPTIVFPSHLHTPVLETMTKLVESHKLCFRAEVADDLVVTARGEVIAGWASGLGAKLRSFKADIAYARPLMAHVKGCGFPEGFEQLDGKEPSLASLGRLACQYAAEGTSFVFVTDDVGESPLGPTAEQLCHQASWTMVGPRKAVELMGMKASLI